MTEDLKDLVVLAADKDVEQALRGLFARPEALDIRPVQADVLVHPQHDPACASRGVEFLSGFSQRYEHGLLMFDHYGSGRESMTARELQESLNQDLGRSPWGERGRAVVLSPELEAWVWSVSPVVDDATGWKDRRPPLRNWLVERGWLKDKDAKPERPKEALVAALHESRTPRSSSLYRKIASRVSLRQCTEVSFLEFRRLLQQWFPRA